MLRVRTPSLGDGGGAAAVNVSVNQTLAAVTQTASLDVDVAVSAVQTLGAVTQSALTDVDVSVSAAQTLAAVTQTGSLDTDVAVSAVQTLGAVTQTAALDADVVVSATQTLPAVTQTAALDVDVVVSATQTLPAVTQTTTVQVVPSGNVVSATQTLAPVTQTATVAVRVNVSVNQTLSPVTPNLVTNPTFGTDISGWSGYSSTDGTSAGLTADATVVSWQAGKLRVASNTGAGHHYAEARQTVTGLTVGRDYTFSADYASTSAGRGALYLNDGSSVAQQMRFVEGVNDGTGSLSTSWVATQTSVTVVLNNVRFTSGFTDFDNVAFGLTSTQNTAVDVDVAVSAAQTLPAVTQTAAVQVVPAAVAVSATQTLAPVTQTATVEHAAVLPELNVSVVQTLAPVANSAFVQVVPVEPRRLVNFARSGFVRGRRDGMRPGFDGDYGRRVATAKTSIYDYEYAELRTRTPGGRG